MSFRKLVTMFALLLFVGGLMGYLKAGSIASLTVSSLFALSFLLCCWLLPQSRAVVPVAVLYLMLLLFFALRFWMTGSFFLPGLFFFVTIAFAFASLISYIRSKG